MDMTRLDRSAARPHPGPVERPLREQPEAPPSPHARPLAEPPATGDPSLFAWRARPVEDHTTSAELLLILQDVLGEQAVPLPPDFSANQQPGETADLLLLDHPLPAAAPGPADLPLDLLYFTAATPLPPEEDGPVADEPDDAPLPDPPPIRGPASGWPEDDTVRSEGSVARGLAFGAPLSVLLWGGIVAAVRWLFGR